MSLAELSNSEQAKQPWYHRHKFQIALSLSLLFASVVIVVLIPALIHRMTEQGKHCSTAALQHCSTAAL